MAARDRWDNDATAAAATASGDRVASASNVNPPAAAAAAAAAAPSSEREMLLARASINNKTPGRQRSDSYGSSSRSNEPALPPRRGSPAAAKGGYGYGYGTGTAEEDGTGVFKPLTGRKDSTSTSTPLVKAKVEENPPSRDGSTLVMAFIVMIVVGTGNRVFMKLQTYPMYNYPFFLSILSTFIYVPVCFVYIIPMLAFGSAITPAQRTIPKFKFAVMGLLDSVAGIMGVFAVNYISNAAMIVLLQQAAIPISMFISKTFLGATYTVSQYTGASVVIAGIIVTLIPTFLGHAAGGDDPDALTQIIWSGVQVLSCIPMCLSSVYKEKALGDDDMDVIYLNGWVAVFQFLASIVFAVPSAYAMGLPVADLPLNTYQGFRCFLGHNSHFADMANMAAGVSKFVPPDHCETAPLFVSIYLCFNLVYNVVLIVILKYGSANVLFLASTVMVPIGNVAFSLKFVPHHQDLHLSDTMGLIFILSGLVVYRFSEPVLAYCRGRSKQTDMDRDSDGRANEKVSRFVGMNQLEYLEPLIKNQVWRAQRARLLRSPQQIRASFMHRLGLPPSPKVAATPTSRTSPYTAHAPRGSTGSSAYRSPAGSAYRASPSAGRTAPGGRPSPPGRVQHPRVSPLGYRRVSEPQPFRPIN